MSESENDYYAEIIRTISFDNCADLYNAQEIAPYISEEQKKKALDYMHLCVNELQDIAAIADQEIKKINLSYLYDKNKKMLSIGYDVANNVLRNESYNMLCSEARLAVFAGIAKSELPQEVWFNLDRSYIDYHGKKVLIAWTATMFEYLMPLLWMKYYPNTLLEQSLQAAVVAQKEYGVLHNIPWGISESSYSDLTKDGVYRYYAFGIPDLAMSKQNEVRLVVSPYSSFLALMVDQDGALDNLKKLKDKGLLGKYGFYEAIDYQNNSQGTIVYTWMAHHQGMSLMAMTNVLCDNILVRRFHQEPLIAATERILHEQSFFDSSHNDTISVLNAPCLDFQYLG